MYKTISPFFYYSELKRYERKKSFIGHQYLTIKPYYTSAFPVSFTPNQPLEPIHILFYATLAIKTKSALNHNMYSSY